MVRAKKQHSSPDVPEALNALRPLVEANEAGGLGEVDLDVDGKHDLRDELEMDHLEELQVDPSLLREGGEPNMSASTSSLTHLAESASASAGDLDIVLERNEQGVVIGWKDHELNQAFIANTDEDNIPALQYVSNLSRFISQYPALSRPANFPSYNTLTGIRTRLKGLSPGTTSVVRKEGDDRCTLCKTNGRAKTAKVALGCWVQEGAWTSCAGCQSRGRSGDCSFSRSAKRRTEKKDAHTVNLAEVVQLGGSLAEYGELVYRIIENVELQEKDKETVREFESKLREFEALLKAANVKGDTNTERGSEEANGQDEPLETLNSPRKKRKEEAS